ncbi:MAG TPA: hypothetical protein DIW17_02775, partial [Clostridiales bacterium]|nr:hypothetical protein [Clostridiales bacterium]
SHICRYLAQGNGRYDFMKDLGSTESQVLNQQYRFGYVLLLTNDLSYCFPPRNNNVEYAAFSIHGGAGTQRTMA